MALRRPKNLHDYLVRAKLQPLFNSNQGNKGNVHCKSNRCNFCNYVIASSSFTGHTTKRSYHINYQLDCNSNNVVYLITCKVCGLRYVGSTSTKFRLRFNNHKSRLRAHSRKSNIDKESDDFVYKHFHGPGHHGLQDVSIQIIDKIHNNEKLVVKEGEWAYRLQTLKPECLKPSEFFSARNVSWEYDNHLSHFSWCLLFIYMFQFLFCFVLFSGFVPLWFILLVFIASALFVFSSPLLCELAMLYVINQVCLVSRVSLRYPSM